MYKPGPSSWYASTRSSKQHPLAASLRVHSMSPGTFSWPILSKTNCASVGSRLSMRTRSFFTVQGRAVPRKIMSSRLRFARTVSDIDSQKRDGEGAEGVGYKNITKATFRILLLFLGLIIASLFSPKSSAVNTNVFLRYSIVSTSSLIDRQTSKRLCKGSRASAVRIGHRKAYRLQVLQS